MVIVREHINEKFKENSDPIKDMEIGMDHISFKLKSILIWYITEKNNLNKKWLNDEQIIEYLKNPNKKSYTFGKRDVKYFIKSTYFVGEYKNEHVVYESLYELISDNYYYIKYQDKYYKIKVKSES